MCIRCFFIVSQCVLLTIFSYAQTLTDVAGKKQGYWKKVDDNTHKLQYEGLFKDNIPQGIFKYYYPNDSLKAKMKFVKNGTVAYSTLYHMSGKKMAEGKYIKEEKDSLWRYYDEKQILISTENFTLGKKNGKVTVYFPDGIVSEERTYKMNIQDGPFKLFFDRTNIKGEGLYVNGELEGKNAYYYPNGVAAAIGFYKNGKKTGPWLYRETNGKTKEKELYKNGELADSKETEAFFTKNKIADEKPKKPTELKSATTKKYKNNFKK